jgi:hypothetical protein
VATLTIRRPRSWGEAGKARHLKVFVDGHEAATLRPGRSAVIDLPPGRHEVMGKVDWTTSPALTFDLDSAGALTVEVSQPFSSIFDAVFRPHGSMKIRIVP